MIEEHGDLWLYFGQPNHRVGISTNGTIRRDGLAVMGRGCALEATRLFPEVQQTLGAYLKIHGNVPGYLHLENAVNAHGDRLLILPVKHNWHEKASLELVTKSVAFLLEESQAHLDLTLHVPRLGCGNGRLSWDALVKGWMQALPDNVFVHH